MHKQVLISNRRNIRKRTIYKKVRLEIKPEIRKPSLRLAESENRLLLSRH